MAALALERSVQILSVGLDQQLNAPKESASGAFPYFAKVSPLSLRAFRLKYRRNHACREPPETG